jgi:Fe2+ transport system protein FeoA
MLIVNNMVRGSMRIRRSIYDLSVGENSKIIEFEDSHTAKLLTGMGLHIGKDIKCVYESGTIVIASNNMTTAIGKEMAKKIYVL